MQPPQGHYSPDGRWWWDGYQWVPVPQPSPAPGYAYGPAAPKTNGLAIASFVLSLLWIAGLGSLLAVIFGISSRNSIKRSHGQQTGDGFAIAGLIIGIVGLLGAILFYATIVSINHAVIRAPAVAYFSGHENSTESGAVEAARRLVPWLVGAIGG